MKYLWRGDDNFALLSRVNLKKVNGFFSKTITLDPGEAVVVRKDGISSATINEGSVRLMNFWDLILSIFKKDRIQAFILDISPFDVDMHIMDETIKSGSLNTGGTSVELSLVEQYMIGGTLISKDKQTVGISLRLNVSIDADSVDMFLGIIKGRNNISASHVWARLDQIIHQRILSPLIEEKNFDELKGMSTRKIIEDLALPQLSTLLNGYGLILHNLSTRWHITKKEFEKNLPVDLDNLLYKKVSFEGEEFEFTYGQFFIYLGVIFFIFIILIWWII